MAETYEQMEMPLSYEETDGKEFSPVATSEEVTNRTVLSDTDYNGVTINNEDGIKIISSLNQLLLNATKGIEISKLSNGQIQFSVDAVTGDVTFLGKLSGATGDFNGKLTADKVYIDPPTGLATLLLKSANLADVPSYTAIYSSPVVGGDIGITGYEETDGSFPPLTTFTAKALNINLVGNVKADSFGDMANGSTVVTPSAANVPTSKVVSFGKTLDKVPTVVATPVSSVVGTEITGIGVSSVTTSGFTLWVTRTNTTDTTINWIAMDS